MRRYRATTNVKVPLRVIPTVTEIGTTKVSYDVTVKTAFGNKLSATNVVLRIPTPLNTTSVDCQVATGKAKYVPAENVVVWKIPRLQGGQECTFSGAAELTSTTTRQVWARPPIDVDFQVLMFTSSGLIVRFLKVFEKSNYNSIKWVRYLTKASGSYQIRVSVVLFFVLFWCADAWTVLMDGCFVFCFDALMDISEIHSHAGGSGDCSSISPTSEGRAPKLPNRSSDYINDTRFRVS